LEREAENIQKELKREKDRQRDAASRWYAQQKQREEGAIVAAMLGGCEYREEEEGEEEDEGYSKLEWAQLQRILSSHGSDIMQDFQRELARKRQRDREDRRREREEEEEEDDDEGEQQQENGGRRGKER